MAPGVLRRWGRLWYRDTPRWLRGVLSVTAGVLGVVLIIRPATTLGALAVLIGTAMLLAAVLELVARTADEDRPRWRIATAIGWTIGGLFVLAWPALTVDLVAVTVGILLVINGVGSVLSATRRAHTWDVRVADAAFGVAGIVFGVLALVWPDVTLLVVAVVFGARLIMYGVVELRRAVRGTAPGDEPERQRRRGRVASAVASAVLAVALAAVSLMLHGGTPVVDAFYAAPRDVPAEPGQLIRAEVFERGVPETARAWRILYTTTDGEDEPRVASGLVVVPRQGAGDWPVIDWAHGTTGAAQHCAPSLLSEPFESGALFLLPDVIAAGWALVASDYTGLGTAGPHPYLVGDPTARSVLDARRAAAQLADADLGARTVVWGHSQGGGAALWAGAIADGYAPDVPIEGVVAMAPAADTVTLIDAATVFPGGSIFTSYAVEAYTRTYDDVTRREYLRPGVDGIVRTLAQRCLAEPGLAVSVLTALGLSQDPDIFSQPPTEGRLGARLTENIAPPGASAPLLIAQGAADSLVGAVGQDEYVARLCAAGQQVDYRRYDGMEHVSLVQPGSAFVPELMAWTAARFAGEETPDGCAVTGR